MNEKDLLEALKADDAGDDASSPGEASDPAAEAFADWQKHKDLESFRALVDTILNED